MSLLDQLNDYHRLNRGQLGSPGWTKSGAWRAFSTATGVSLAMAGSVDAAIVYSGVQNVAIQINPASSVDTSKGGLINFSSGLVDIDGGGPDLVMNARYGMELATAGNLGQGVERSFNMSFFGGTGMALTATTPGAGSAMINQVARKIPSGVNIGSAATFGGNNILLADLFRITIDQSNNTFLNHSGNYGKWNLGVSAIAGFALGTNNFGWIRLRIDDNFGSDGQADTLTAVDWAYRNTAGVNIAAGAVPEPSVGLLALLAAGVAGITRTRKIRDQRASAEPSA